MSTPSNSLASALGVDRDDHAPLRFLGETGFLCLYRRQWERADALFAGLRALVPEDPVGYLGGAELALAQGRSDDAVALTREQLSNARCDPEATAFVHTLRGRAREVQGDVKRALAAYETAIDIDARSQAAHAARDRITRIQLLEAGCTPERRAEEPSS